jgi:hypothetical protein
MSNVSGETTDCGKDTARNMAARVVMSFDIMHWRASAHTEPIKLA